MIASAEVLTARLRANGANMIASAEVPSPHVFAPNGAKYDSQGQAPKARRPWTNEQIGSKP